MARCDFLSHPCQTVPCGSNRSEAVGPHQPLLGAASAGLLVEALQPLTTALLLGIKRAARQQFAGGPFLRHTRRKIIFS
jgi:hypothetical protein